MNRTTNLYVTNKPIVNLKTEADGLEVEYEILPYYETDTEIDPRRREILEKLGALDERIAVNNGKIEEFDKQIEKLTNHADALDYAVAAASGLVTGLIDAFFGDKLNELVKGQTDRFVSNVAKMDGYQNKGGDQVTGAIKHLEKHKIPGDSYRGDGISRNSHHIDDIAHHPTIWGLVESISRQFTGNAAFINKSGKMITVDVSGELVGGTIPEKLFAGTVNWLFHLASDMAGSSTTRLDGGSGTGIPGPILSVARELSALPGINKTGLAELTDKAFGNGIDLRKEIAQSIPVMLNTAIVRAFYFIRRLVGEIKQKGSFGDIDWSKVLPWGNRTIARMMTIASSAFLAVNIAQAAVKSGGFNPSMVAHINIAGVGSFFISCINDIGMGIKRSRLRTERMALYNEQMRLMNAKIYYKQADMWIAAEDTYQAIKELDNAAEQSVVYFVDTVRFLEGSLDRIGGYAVAAEKYNPGLIGELTDILDDF